MSISSNWTTMSLCMDANHRGGGGGGREPEGDEWSWIVFFAAVALIAAFTYGMLT